MQTIHIAIHKASKQAFFFAGKRIPMSDKNYSARFKYWPVTSLLEKIGTAKVVSWNDDHNDQSGQLQSALGEAWRVLTQYEALQAAVMGAKQAGMFEAERNETSEFSEAFRKFRNVQTHVDLVNLY